MSVYIDHTNYEAFYLDYLEGNLSGDALKAFEAFLAAHPELAVLDESLISVPLTDETFDTSEKLLLKKSIDSVDLSAETISFFLIARGEHLLSQEQEAHLDNWLSANAYYRQDAALFALTKMKAEPQLVYTNKQALKRTPARVIPLWFTGAAVAAGLALIITLAVPNGSEQPGTAGSDLADSDPVKVITDKADHPKNKQSGTGTYDATSNDPAANGNQYAAARRFPAAGVQNTPDAASEIAALGKHNLRPVQPATNELQPLARFTPVPAPEAVTPEPSSNDLAWVPVDQMPNPLEPITSRLSHTLNTPVDFRSAKASKKKQGGFYLKIGKLEISHRSASL